MAKIDRTAQQPSTGAGSNLTVMGDTPGIMGGATAAPGDLIAAEKPAPMALTYGSWMELGLATRQMMAASRPPDTATAPG